MIAIPSLSLRDLRCLQMTYSRAWVSILCFQLESIAVRPTVPDPRMNTAKCITRGHGKATFTGVKQCLGGLCWMILLAALLFTLPAFWLLMHVQWKAELKKEENKREQSDSPDSNEMRALASSYPVEETPNPADSTDMGALKRAVIATGAAQKAVDELKQQSEARAGASTAEQATSTEAPAAVPKPPSSNGNGKSNLTETDSMILEMAKTATKATAEATEKAKGATKSIPRWEKIAEAASKADAAAAVVKVASERIEALKRDAPVGMMARSAADLAKLATAAAEEEAKEKVAKEAKVATREAVVLLLWLFTCASLVATLVLTVFAFHYDGQKSVAEDNCCPIAYLVITCAFFIYSCFYCSCKCCPRCCGCYELVSWYYIIVLPSIFIIIHHLLWVFFGMITEPFWALPLLLAISSASFTLYQFACLHRKVHSDVTRCKEILTKYETWFFSLSFLTLCLVLFNITLVGQAFFSDNVVAVIVQSLLTFVITLWLKELSAKYD